MTSGVKVVTMQVYLVTSQSTLDSVPAPTATLRTLIAFTLKPSLKRFFSAPLLQEGTVRL